MLNVPVWYHADQSDRAHVIARRLPIETRKKLLGRLQEIIDDGGQYYGKFYKIEKLTRALRAFKERKEDNGTSDRQVLLHIDIKDHTRLLEKYEGHDRALAIELIDETMDRVKEQFSAEYFTVVKEEGDGMLLRCGGSSEFDSIVETIFTKAARLLHLTLLYNLVENKCFDEIWPKILCVAISSEGYAKSRRAYEAEINVIDKQHCRAGSISLHDECFGTLKRNQRALFEPFIVASGRLRGQYHRYSVSQNIRCFVP